MSRGRTGLDRHRPRPPPRREMAVESELKEESMRRRRWTLAIPAVLVIAILAVIFWPTGDPFAGVERVAVQSPDWGETPREEIIQGPFIEGLQITLGEKNITIVGDLEKADAVLAIKEIKLGKLEVLIAEGRIHGRASATCILTNLKTGEEYLMDFYLTLENGRVEARLVTRKFWQFWR